MTIYEYDTVSAGRDGDPAQPRHRTHALVDRLNAGEPYAVAFGGQGSAWLETLEELVSSAGIEDELATLVGEAEMMLEPVARELVVVRPIGFDPLRWVRALAAEEPVPSAEQLMSAACSLPGVAAHPGRRDARTDPPGYGFRRHSARRGRRALPGRAGRRSTARRAAPRTSSCSRWRS